MMTWRRRTRAAIRMGLTWALAWFGAGTGRVGVGRHLYSIPARDPNAEPGPFDKLQLALVVCALLVDAMALWAILARITEFGFSPNRVAALGENLILLANLGGAAVLYARFLRGRKGFASLERWQTNFLPVYLAWAVVVVVLFPIFFRFV